MLRQDLTGRCVGPASCAEDAALQAEDLTTNMLNGNFFKGYPMPRLRLPHRKWPALINKATKKMGLFVDNP